MKNRRSFFAGMLTMALLCTLVVSASAAYAKVTKTLSYQDIKVTLNGEQLNLRDAKGNKAYPFIMDGTTYLPIRAVSESLNLNVDWNSDTKTVILSGDTGSSNVSEVKSLLGFYKTLESGFRDLESFYADLADSSKTSSFTSTTPLTSDGATFSKLLLDKLTNTGDAIERGYSNCKAAGLTGDSELELMVEYRRLNTQAINILSQFITGANSSFISSAMGSAKQNAFDSSIQRFDAEISFYQLCNKK